MARRMAKDPVLQDLVKQARERIKTLSRPGPAPGPAQAEVGRPLLSPFTQRESAPPVYRLCQKIPADGDDFKSP